MSAYPPTAAQRRTLPDFREGRKAAVSNHSKTTQLFNHLIGGHLHDHRHGEAERLSGLEVEREFECRRLKNRQFPRLGPLQDFPDIHTSLTVGVGKTCGVAYQAVVADI